MFFAEKDPAFSGEFIKAAEGFEPTDNGFANRPPNSVTNCNKSTSEFDEKNLASCLALLKEKYPDLQQIISAWPELPEHIKQTVKILVESQK